MKVRACEQARGVCSRARRGACPCGGWGRHFSRAAETVARSTDTRRTRCSGEPGFSSAVSAAIRQVQRFTGSIPPHPHGARLRPCNRYTREHPSPSAREFGLLLNGLATFELRRMFLQLTLIRHWRKQKVELAEKDDAPGV